MTVRATAPKLRSVTELEDEKVDMESAERQAVGWPFSCPTTVDAAAITTNLRCFESTPVPLAQIRNSSGSEDSGGAGTEQQYSSEYTKYNVCREEAS